MQTQIISAYLSQDGNIVAIASDCYYVLKRKFDDDKSKELIEKINSVRMIDTEYWEKRND